MYSTKVSVILGCLHLWWILVSLYRLLISPNFYVWDLTEYPAKWIASELKGQLRKICSVDLMRLEFNHFVEPQRLHRIPYLRLLGEPYTLLYVTVRSVNRLVYILDILKEIWPFPSDISYELCFFILKYKNLWEKIWMWFESLLFLNVNPFGRVKSSMKQTKRFSPEILAVCLLSSKMSLQFLRLMSFWRFQTGVKSLQEPNGGIKNCRL